MGKVWQLQRWVIACLEERQCGKEGKGRLQFCGGRIVG